MAAPRGRASVQREVLSDRLPAVGIEALHEIVGKQASDEDTADFIEPLQGGGEWSTGLPDEETRDETGHDLFA